MFNNQPNNNIFGQNNSSQQPQSQNPFQTNTGNNFQNQQSQNSFMGNNQQNNNVFSNNNQQQGGNQTGGNIFGNSQPQGNQNNIFGNNQTSQGNNVFGNNQANQSGNIFGNNQANQGNQSNNIFGNNQQQTNNAFGSNQMQNNVFNNQAGQTNQGSSSIFNNQGNIGSNAYNNQQNQAVSANPFNNQIQPNFNTNLTNQNQFSNLLGIGQNGFNLSATQVRQNANRVIEQQIKIMGALLMQVQSVKLSQNNEFKDMKINAIPELKQAVITIRKQIKQLKEHARSIKNKRKQLEKEQITYIESTRNKLRDYKECLTQRLSQDSMIQGIRNDINDISNEIQSFFKPMINAYKREESIAFIDPGQFELDLSKKILSKMEAIKERIQDLQACQGESVIQGSTIQVFEQLLEYYQNVSLAFKDFISTYTDMKKDIVQKSKRGYEELMREIDKERIASMGKGFRHYEILKNISSLLDEKQKKQRETTYKTLEREKPKPYY